MTEDQLALLGDTRLPPAARVIGLMISLAGPEGVELRRSALGALLHGAPSDDTVGRHLRALEQTQWVVRAKGGRGHPDTYRILARHECGAKTTLRSALSGELKDSLALRGVLKPLSTPLDAELRAPTSSSLPPPPPPNARVREFVLSRETMEGCRTRLLDYLAERIEPGFQLGYAQTVAGMIEGSDEQVWRKPTGAVLTDGRAGIVGACLNELRAGDERGKYFPGPPGDVRNLRSKIRYRVKEIDGQERDAKRRRAASPAGAEPRGRPRREVRVEG